MNSLMWLNGYATMYAQPNPNGKRVRDLTEKSLVYARDEVVLWQGVPFMAVEYQDATTWRGWVYAGMLEDYVEKLPKNCVVLDDQTPVPNDFEQYLVFNGAKQVNLCGQISVAYCLGLSLTVLLGLWKQAAAGVWTRIFKRFGYTAGGTGVDDLLSMFEAAKVKAYPLADVMRDPWLKRPRYTVTKLKRLAETGRVVAGVTIDKAGRLAKSGDLHWLVVTTVEPERCGYGLVTLFNPAPNRVEVYSWSEFVAAAKIPSGAYAPEGTL